jgi:hypothetical protein
MTRNQRTILLAVVAAVVMVVTVVVGVSVWFATSLVHNTDMSETAAMQTIDDVRARFGALPPVLTLQPQGVTMSRRPPDTGPAGDLKTLHVLRWDQFEERLTRVEVPFWLLRLRDGPIDVSYDDGTGAGVKVPLTIRVSDLERFGPALLLDGSMPDGGHVVAWSE